MTRRRSFERARLRVVPMPDLLALAARLEGETPPDDAAAARRLLRHKAAVREELARRLDSRLGARDHRA